MKLNNIMVRCRQLEHGVCIITSGDVKDGMYQYNEYKNTPRLIRNKHVLSNIFDSAQDTTGYYRDMLTGDFFIVEKIDPFVEVRNPTRYYDGVECHAYCNDDMIVVDVFVDKSDGKMALQFRIARAYMSTKTVPCVPPTNKEEMDAVWALFTATLVEIDAEVALSRL